jgi:hypothetical protein
MWQNPHVVPNATLANLQRQLRDKFPMARHGLAPVSAEPRLEFDLRNPASFPCGGITEIVPAHPAAGLSLFVASLLEHEAADSVIPELALIDGRDNFDPGSFSSNECSRLLWIRCKTPEQSIKAADLILRDGNLPRVVIDLLAFPMSELRKIPSSVWHRLKQLIEVNVLSVIALCPHALVPCARLRLSMSSGFTLDHLLFSREELVQQLRSTSVLQRRCAQ